MDEAAVSTIHSFCNRMLSEHAFDSGSLFKLTLETDQSELLDEVARDYWRTFVYPLPPMLMDEALSHWKTPGDLRQGVRNLIDDPQSLGTPPDSVHQAIDQVVRRRLEQSQALKAHPWSQWREEVTQLLNDLNKAKRLHGGSKNAMIKVWDFLFAWAESDDLLPKRSIVPQASRIRRPRVWTIFSREMDPPPIILPSTPSKRCWISARTSPAPNPTFCATPATG